MYAGDMLLMVHSLCETVLIQAVNLIIYNGYKLDWPVNVGVLEFTLSVIQDKNVIGTICKVQVLSLFLTVLAVLLNASEDSLHWVCSGCILVRLRMAWTHVQSFVPANYNIRWLIKILVNSRLSDIKDSTFHSISTKTITEVMHSRCRDFTRVVIK